jgi:Mrp family chromosome partitioning ATPase
MSGKGGVGTSTVAALLASGLRRKGAEVGLLDGDLTNPSALSLFGTPIELAFDENGAIEALRSRTGIRLMSMHVFQERTSDPIVWRGPMLSSAFKQLYRDINWGNLDYLIVDVPTGTADVPMTVLTTLKPDGIVLVTTPQNLALAASERCVGMIRQLGGRIVGSVQNMTYLLTEEHAYHELFGPGHPQQMEELTGAPQLADLLLDPYLNACCDTGMIEGYCSMPTNALINSFLASLSAQTGIAEQPSHLI